MIRIIISITCILFLFSQVSAEEIGNTNNTGPAWALNLSNTTTNASQQVPLNTTQGENQSVLSSRFNGTDGDSRNSIIPDHGKTSAPLKPEPVYKESVGSTYDPDYTEPQPMTFTYSGSCQ